MIIAGEDGARVGGEAGAKAGLKFGLKVNIRSAPLSLTRSVRIDYFFLHSGDILPDICLCQVHTLANIFGSIEADKYQIIFK